MQLSPTISKSTTTNDIFYKKGPKNQHHQISKEPRMVSIYTINLRYPWKWSLGLVTKPTFFGNLPILRFFRTREFLRLRAVSAKEYNRGTHKKYNQKHVISFCIFLKFENFKYRYYIWYDVWYIIHDTWYMTYGTWKMMYDI